MQALKKDQLSIPNTHLSKQSAFNMGVGNTMVATGLLLAIFNVTVSRLKIVTDTDWACSRQTKQNKPTKKGKRKKQERMENKLTKRPQLHKKRHTHTHKKEALRQLKIQKYNFHLNLKHCHNHRNGPGAPKTL